MRCKITYKTFSPKSTSSMILIFFFSSRRRHTRLQGDWSSDVCSSDLSLALELPLRAFGIGPGDEVVTTPRTFVEIGRASCRERVKILAVAGYVIKKEIRKRGQDEEQMNIADASDFVQEIGPEALTSSR